MANSTRFPRKAKKQKLDQHGEAGIRQEHEHIHKSTTSSESWRKKAKEAQEYRDESVDEVVLLPTDLKSSPQHYLQIPSLFLDDEERAISMWTPDQIVGSIARGEIDSYSIAKAFLRRAGIAAKLVSHHIGTIGVFKCLMNARLIA